MQGQFYIVWPLLTVAVRDGRVVRSLYSNCRPVDSPRLAPRMVSRSHSSVGATRPTSTTTPRCEVPNCSHAALCSPVRGATNRMVDRMNTQGDRRNGGCVSDRPVIPSTCARYLCVALHCQRRHVHFWTRIRGRDRRRNSRRNRGDDSLLCSPTLARNSVLQPLPVPLANNRAGHQTEFGAHQTVADVVSARTHARCDSVVLLARPGAASEVAIRQTKGSRRRVMNHSRYR